MRPLRAGSSKSAKGLAAFVFAMFLGYASESAATVGDCGTDKPPPAKDVPVMTIQIFNNSDSFSIYPVINMGQGPKDEWLQAWFKVPESKFADCPFPRTPNNYRLFLNPRGAGIPPRKSLTVTLPLATQLVKSIDPKKPGQFADWWPGGEILIFDSPKGKGPPAALTAALN
ncbi:MAG TPA: hypothetical protein VFF88_00420, partial [Methylocella sp.]|nr:hypothetical protein [Methylocella sp.]